MHISAKKLVTEELRKHFGDIKLQIIKQDAKRRVGCLRRVHDDAALAYHSVTYDRKGVRAMGRLHDEIVAGKLMGEAIKHSGISHVRRVRPPSVSKMSPFLVSLFRTKKKKCRVQLVDYTIRGEPYALIEEFYNPEFVSVRHVKRPPRSARTRARKT